MIRPATMADLRFLVDLSFAVYEEMHWKDHGVSITSDGVVDTLMWLITSDDADVSIVELDGVPCGACAVAFQERPMEMGIKTATEFGWNMHPAFPDGATKRKWFVRMLDHMISWAKGRGAATFRCGVSNGPAAKLLERRGIRCMELVHVGRL